MKLLFMWTVQRFNPNIGTHFKMSWTSDFLQAKVQSTSTSARPYLSPSCPVSTLWKCLFFSQEGKCLPRADYLQTDHLLTLWQPYPSPASLKIQTHTVQASRSDQRKRKLFLFLFGSLSPTYINNPVTSTVTEVLQDKSKLKEKKRKIKFQ